MLHTDLRPLIDHAESLMRAKQFDRAVEAWKKVVADPSSPRGARHRLASAHRKNGQLDEAVKLLRATVQDIPEYQAAHDLLSDILSELAAPVQFKFRPVGDARLTVDAPRTTIRLNPDGQATLAGWIFFTNSDHVEATLVLKNGERLPLPINKARPDVVAALSSRGMEVPALVCGFSVDAPLHAGSHIEVTRNAELTKLMITADRLQQAVEGKDGWLFLANDSNRSLDLFTNALVPDSVITSGWLDFVNALQSSFPQTRQCFLITPSKETVHPDRHPLKPGPQFIGQRVKRALADNPVSVHYPVAALRAVDRAYYDTDTHWSDLGAAVALKEILSGWSLNIDPVAHVSFEARMVLGDLGSKVEPRRTSKRLVAIPPLDAHGIKEFRSQESNTGEFFISSNDNAPIPYSIALFGGSSTGHLFAIAKHLFRQVFRANSPSHMPIKEVMEVLRPTFLIVQANERYLMKPPMVSSVKGTKLGRSLSYEYSEADRADVYPLRSFLRRHWV